VTQCGLTDNGPLNPRAAAMPDIYCNCPSDCGWYEYSERFEGSREGSEDGDDY